MEENRSLFVCGSEKGGFSIDSAADPPEASLPFLIHREGRSAAGDQTGGSVAWPICPARFLTPVHDHLSAAALLRAQDHLFCQRRCPPTQWTRLREEMDAYPRL